MSLESCEWGMEGTVLGVPLVVENRPFILAVQKSAKDLPRCLGGLATHALLRHGGVGAYAEGGAERQVDEVKAARNRR